MGVLRTVRLIRYYAIYLTLESDSMSHVQHETKDTNPAEGNDYKS